MLTLIERMLTAGAMQNGRLFPTTQGTPQGGVVSPLLSNILLTPFDREMRRRGYQLTRCRRLGGDVQESARSGSGTAVRGKDPRDPGRADQFAENAGRARTSRVSHSLGTRSSAAGGLHLRPRRSSPGRARRSPTQRSSTGSRMQFAGRRGVAFR